MRSSLYQTSPGRFHPEFIGIAYRYSDHKRKRQLVQRRKEELDSDYQYTSKLDSSLEKRLEAKALELQRLQQARQRHEQQLAFKREMQALRLREIENQKQRNTQTRLENKRNIEQSRRQLQDRNHSTRKKLQADLARMTRQYEQSRANTLQQRSEQYYSIRESRIQGQLKVDEFHREKNRESLTHYQANIRKESKLRKQHHQQIKDYQYKLADLSKTVEYKQGHLQLLEEEIGKYRTDPVRNSRRRSQPVSQLTLDPSLSYLDNPQTN